MYQNEWKFSSDRTAIEADVWIVSAEGYTDVTGHQNVPIQGNDPVLMMGGWQRPVVLVPHQSTVRKTRAAYKEAAKLAQRLEPGQIAVVTDGLTDDQQTAALWGLGQGFYQYRDLTARTTGVSVILATGSNGLRLERSLAVVESQSLVRDWVNLPSNLKPPRRLAELMMANSPSSIHWTMFDHKMLSDLGAGGILGVGQGSHRPPVMLVGRYEGNPGMPWIALVGKGITFDSGGISLKPGEGMGRMKGDMGGAAAVIGAIRAVAHSELQVNVLAVTPLAENLPGGGAYRPGDVLTLMDGTTVEVISTDAEGRLVLGDGVSWARRQGVSAIVDMATLTGANVVALGGVRSALVTNHEPLGSLVKDASTAAAEPTWELPHDEDYADFNKTTAADIKNSGGRPAGTITAGLFIGHFAKGTPWAHLDIAGLAFDTGNGIGAGATGYGVATLVEVCRQFGEEGLS